jgi:uncharacterized membrane protein
MNSSWTSFGFSTIAVVCGLMGTQAHAQKYQVTDLGVGQASGLNNLGQVIGQAPVPLGVGLTSGVIWSANGQVTMLGALPGDAYSDAIAINDQGTVLGSSYRKVSSGNHSVESLTPYIWTKATGMQTLPWLPPQGKPGFINNAGQISGHGLEPGDLSYYSKPFIWQADAGLTFLQETSGVFPSTVYGMNQAGMVVGYATPRDGTQINSGFFWSAAAGFKNLTSPSKTLTDLIPTAINGQGQVVGYIGNATSEQRRLFTWSIKGGVTILNPLSTYTHGERPISIDKNYKVVGNASPHAFVWTLFTGRKDINTLLANNGPANQPVAVIYDVSGVNDLGQISANATINGEAHAVLLTPVK